MRKLLSILFLTIFTFQILPIKQIGKILWSGQMTEEVHEHGSCHKKMNPESQDKLWYAHFANSIISSGTQSAGYKHFIRDEALIKCHEMDVRLQPPNC